MGFFSDLSAGLVSKAASAAPNTAINIDGTYYQPQYASTGSGETFEQGPLTGFLSYAADANKPGGAYSTYDPTGKFTGTGTQQKVSNNMLPFLLAAGGMAFGLPPGLGEVGAAGTAGMTAAEIAALTATDLAVGGGALAGTAPLTAAEIAALTAQDLAIGGGALAGTPPLTIPGLLPPPVVVPPGGGVPPVVTPPVVPPPVVTPVVTPPVVPPVVVPTNLANLAVPAAIAATSLIGADAAKTAAATQANSATQANELLYKMYQEQKGLQEPFRGAGISAQNRLLDLLGLSQNKGAEGFGRYSKDFGMSDFTADPGYAFRLSEGQKALERNAAARGGLISGGALKAATRYGQDMGSQEYQSAFNRYQTNRANQLAPLGSLLSTGQAAASNQSAAAGNYGTQAGGNLTSAGAATAAGQVGTANALTNALGSYLNYSSSQNLADSIRKSTYGV